MIKKNVRRYIILFLGVLLVFVIQVIPVGAKATVQKQNIREISFSKMKVSKNNTKVVIERESKEGKRKIHITADQNDSEYYMPIFYWNQQIKANNYGEFDFYIENPNTSAIQLNLNVTSKAYGSLGLLSGSYAAGVKQDTGEKIYFLIDDYGFEIPSGFMGNVKIPFYLFKEKDSALMVQQNLGVISYLGITVVCKANSDFTFLIADTGLIDTADVMPYTTIADKKIIGDDTISKPSYGKIFTNYQVYAYDMLGNYKNVAADFFLKYQSKGIEINKDGKVIVSSESSANKFILLAKLAGEADVQKQINLKNSWTVSTRTQDGYDASVPRTEEVQKINTNRGFFYSDDLIYIFWGICACGFIVFAIFYLVHRHPGIFSKKENKM